MKTSENLSTYSIYECLQLKKYHNRDQCLRKLSKNLLNLLRVLRGKLTLRPPHSTFASALNCNKWLFVQCRYRTNFWKCQIKLDLLSSQPPPPPGPLLLSVWPVFRWLPKCMRVRNTDFMAKVTYTVTKGKKPELPPIFFLNFMFLSFSPRIFSMLFFCIPSFI